MSILTGTLYIVATPIGNLDDLSPRALRVLGEVDRVAAEDTRHSGRLLAHFGISARMLALHEHNEEQASSRLIDYLLAGESVALISDAGTPLISDPGYPLVRRAHEVGVSVVPIPGPSALIAALSVSGLPTDRFCFEGFLPAKAGARRRRLEALVDETRTLVFYESPHRIVDCVGDLAAILGEGREALLARELTKAYETLHRATLGQLQQWIGREDTERRGEFVLVVAGSGEETSGRGVDGRRIAAVLAEDLPKKQAAALAARISGERRNELYDYLLQLDKNG